jgi:hypothetical protein
MSYFFDSYAIIQTLLEAESYQRFKEEQIITNGLHMAETVFFFLKTNNKDVLNRLKLMEIVILGIDKDIAFDSAKFKFDNSGFDLSYADCIGYITSMNNGLTFLTGDYPFKNIEDVEFVR